MKNKDLTWKDVLINNGFDKSTSDSLIGFISWQEGELFAKLGHEINDVLNGYEGKVIAMDVVSEKYGDKGLMFTKTNISNNIANSIFNSILDYEHQEVYDYSDREFLENN